MSTPKRRRVYEVVERAEFPYFEPGDKVKFAPKHRNQQPVVRNGEVQWVGSGAALSVYTVEKYMPALNVGDWAGINLKEISPNIGFNAEELMPADWTDEEWEASEANPLIVNRPIVPENPQVKLEFLDFTTDDKMTLGRIFAEMMGMHSQEIEFFNRLKEREAELESIARTQEACQSDES